MSSATTEKRIGAHGDLWQGCILARCATCDVPYVFEGRFASPDEQGLATCDLCRADVRRENRASCDAHREAAWTKARVA
jgi:hypothetical protein